ncbi:hypothetical protein ON010_g11623 [Phytophthora cinnamomi]|nr:hypothetical protein ON010_g11623 [Phytophthora cinnamomi]
MQVGTSGAKLILSLDVSVAVCARKTAFVTIRMGTRHELTWLEAPPASCPAYFPRILTASLIAGLTEG